MKNKLFLLVLFFAIWVSSCCKSEFGSSLYVESSEVYFGYKYLKDGKLHLVDSRNYNGGISLEIPLASDSAYYYFTDSLENIIDTFAISYKKEFDYKSYDCGMSSNVVDFKMLPESSFKSAKFEYYNNVYLEK